MPSEPKNISATSFVTISMPNGPFSVPLEDLDKVVFPSFIGTTKFSPDDYREFRLALLDALPYEKAVGRIEPYSGSKISNKNDYELYALLLYLRYSAQEELEELRSNNDLLVQENKKLQSDNKSLVFNHRKVLRSLRLFLVSFFVLLILFSCFAILFSRSSHKTISELSSQNFVLQDQLDAANLQIEEMSASVDQSYWNGFISGSKSPSGSTSFQSSSGSSRPWESEAYVESTYIGNSSSKKFHRSSCSYLPSKSSQVFLSSREEAIRSGYDPCKRCDP